MTDRTDLPADSAIDTPRPTADADTYEAPRLIRTGNLRDLLGKSGLRTDTTPGMKFVRRS